jgi:hypothetical protein
MEAVLRHRILFGIESWRDPLPIRCSRRWVSEPRCEGELTARPRSALISECAWLLRLAGVLQLRYILYLESRP